MSRINCETTGDLMPLYVDKVLSPSSVELVEEHLAECEDCAAKVQALQADTVIPLAGSDGKNTPLHRIKRGISRRTALICGATAGVLLIIFGLYVMCNILSVVRKDYPYDEVKDHLKWVSVSDQSVSSGDMGVMLVYDGDNKKFSSSTLFHTLGRSNGKTQVELVISMERSAYDDVNPFYYMQNRIDRHKDDLVFADNDVQEWLIDEDWRNGNPPYNLHSGGWTCYDDTEDPFDNVEIIRIYYGNWKYDHDWEPQITSQRYLIWEKDKSPTE